MKYQIKGNLIFISLPIDDGPTELADRLATNLQGAYIPSIDEVTLYPSALITFSTPVLERNVSMLLLLHI